MLLALCSDVVVLWSAALVPSQAGSSLRKLDALQAGSFSFHNCTSFASWVVFFPQLHIKYTRHISGYAATFIAAEGRETLTNRNQVAIM